MFSYIVNAGIKLSQNLISVAYTFQITGKEGLFYRSVACSPVVISLSGALEYPDSYRYMLNEDSAIIILP